jgi:hypothetical protein
MYLPRTLPTPRATALLFALQVAVGCAQPQPEPPAPLATADVTADAIADAGANAGASSLPPEPMEWPDPLPPVSETAPALMKGLVVGSWAPDGPLGFDEAWLDEAGLTQAWAKDKVGRRVWRAFSVSEPIARLDILLKDRPGPSVGYLYSISQRGLAVPGVADMPAVLHVRHRGRLRLWFDGEAVVDAPAPEAGAWGEARVPVTLRGRYSLLLAKCGRCDPTLGDSMDLEVRLSRPDGAPVESQSWSSMRTPGLYPDP